MNTEDAVYITDTENKIIFVNKAFCKAYGYSEDEVLGKDSQISMDKQKFLRKYKMRFSDILEQ